MSKYYITIFSITAIVTTGFFFVERTLLNNNSANNQTSNLTTVNLSKPSDKSPSLVTANANQWRQQISTLKQELQKHQQSGDITKEISTLNAIAILHNELGESAKAIAYLQQAQNKLNAANIPQSQKPLMESELLMGLATVYADAGKFPQVLEISRKISAIQNRNVGSLAFRIGDVAPTPQATQASTLDTKTDTKQDALMLYTIATTQQKRGKVREAIGTAEAALNLLKTVGDKQGEQEISKYIDSLRQQL